MRSFIVEWLVRAVVIFVVSGAVAMGLRRASASLRAGAWTVTFCGLLTLPVLNGVMPAWAVPVWPASDSRPIAVESEQISAPAAAVPMPLAVRARPAATAWSASEASVAPADARTPRLAAGLVASAAVVLWAVVTVVLLVRLVAAHHQAHCLVDAAEPADAGWRGLVEDARSLLMVRRPVRVLLSDAVTLPAVVGVWRPVLLLPADADRWTPAVRRSVALHELSHVARWDAASQLVERLVCAVYWCLPVAWMSARRAAALREQACDDSVLRAGVGASDYAASLVDLVRDASGIPSASLAMGRPSHLHARVRAILNPSISRRPISGRAGLITGVVAVGAIVAVAAVTPVEGRARAFRQAPSVTSAVEVSSAGPAAAAAATASPRGQATTPTAAAAGLCTGKIDSSSTSVHENDDSRRWTVKLKGPDCSVDFRVDGKVEFNDTFTDIASISNGGTLTLDATDHGVRHQLDVSGRNGSLERRWRVDGAERPYDQEARAWFARFLIELDRRTAVGADQRLPVLLKQGGVSAVLNETALMGGDFARSVYYKKLAAATSLTHGDIARILRQAASMNTSDFYASELMKSLAVQDMNDANVHAAVLDLVKAMSSDFYIAESIKYAMGSRQPSTSDIDLLLSLVPRIKSDFYKAEVCRTVVKAGRLDAPQRAALAGTLTEMHDAFYMAEVVKMLSGSGDLDAAGRTAVIDASGRINSDFYVSEALKPVIDSSGLTDADMLRIVDVARRLKSDFYRSEILVRVARHGSLSDRVRTAIVDAADGLSSFYANQVRRAAGK